MTLNGFKFIGLDGDGYILNSSAYLIAVELYSNGNNNPITILDDKTVIEIHGQAVFTFQVINGTQMEKLFI